MLKINPETELNALIDVATKMCIAARTAPKARGQDFIVTAIIYGEELKKIQEEMVRIGQRENIPFFIRDAENIEDRVVVIIGTKWKKTSEPFEEIEDEEMARKASSLVDLGIAIGSAVSVAKELCVDNRVMYSIGRACINLGILGEDVKVAYGIPLSVSGKNPFFDRVKKT